jgi:hypothetical protein
MHTARDELVQVMGELVADPVTKFTPSAYETAQYLRVGDRPGVRDRQFDYLLATRNVDGSWGEPGYQVIPTLAAVAGLHGRREESGRRLAEVDRAVRDGLDYLWSPVLEGRSHPELPDTVASEIIAPSLVALNQRLLSGHRPGSGELPYFPGANEPLYRKFRDIVDAGEVPPRKIWHSLEIFAPLDSRFAGGISTDDGAVACSPAATVAWLAALDGRVPDDTRDYLAEIESRYDGAIPMGSSMTFFEFLWVCNFALKAPAAPPLPEELVELFARSLTGAGIGGGPGLPPDGDDTAYALIALEKSGWRTDPDILAQFWEDDRFRTYLAEQTPSETTNAHAIEYLSLIERDRGVTRYEAMKRACVDWLCSVQRVAGWWVDKWHISPYYSTGECLGALLSSGVRTPAVDRAVSAAVRWLLGSQSADGGWGFREHSTREESAYAVLALHRYARRAEGPTRAHAVAAIERATDRVRTRGDRPPPMWMGKDLYRPERVVRSVEAAGLGVVEAYAARHG